MPKLYVEHGDTAGDRNNGIAVPGLRAEMKSGSGSPTLE